MSAPQTTNGATAEAARSREYATFFVDGLFFGIDVLQVQEVLRYQEMTRVPLAPAVIEGLINLRGQIVTAVDMRGRLKLRPRADGQTPMNTVVRTKEGAAVSLLVDEIGDVVEVDSDAFEPVPDNVDPAARDLLQGVYKLKDRLLLVLDTEKTIEIASFFDLVPSPVFVMDLAHTVLYINDEAARFFGQAREECVGKKYWDLFDCPGCREGTCAASKAVRTGAVCSGETVGTLRGKETAVRVLAAPRYGRDHQIIGCVQLIVDSSVHSMMAKYLHTIANGEIPAKITDEFHGTYEGVKASMNSLVDTVAMRGKDIQDLTEAIMAGNLSFRPDPAKYPGYSGKMITGLNRMLDAVIDPLHVAARYVDQISKGVVPEKITEAYAGDFNTIKNNLNKCIEGLGALQEADSVLQRMAVNDYSQKVEGSAPGIFGELAQAVNTVQSRVTHVANSVNQISRGDMSELPDYKKIGRRSEHDILVPSLIALMENLRALVDDATMLSKAAVEGALTTRADASKHEGDYRKVIEGVNSTLDAVTEPVQEAAAVIEKIAEQDLTARVEGTYRGDHAAIKNNINRMAGDLRGSIQQITQSASVLASASEELTATSQQMAGNAEETATQANVVSAAAEQVSKNVSVVATGAEQMQTSIREIAKSANEAAKIAKNAVRAADATNKTIGKLGESSLEIGKVIKVITSIAQQTNLLALNATIEAARAGEAGKGFAVVANEVKELAKETAKATEDIGQKIEAIQSDTKGAVQAIAEIGTVINQVNDISNTIASAVEEQTVTTNEIGRNVAEAARGTSDIAKNISGVAQAAQNTTQGASDSQKASASLASMASQLQAIVSKFKL
jgi:methyl-accepting chemotaxis protein